MIHMNKPLHARSEDFLVRMRGLLYDGLHIKLEETLRLTSILGCSIALCSAAMAREVPTVDYRAAVKDGDALIGIECHKRNKTLEVIAINPGHSPGRRMDVWQAWDLLVFDQKTSLLLKTLAVQRSCKLGDDTFKVRLEGVPGNSNAQGQCGHSRPPTPRYGETAARFTTPTWQNAGARKTSQHCALCRALMRQR